MQDKKIDEFSIREDFVQMAMGILAPLESFYSSGGAQLDLGNTAAVYEKEAVWAEAFLRPLWGLIPLWAGGSSTPDWEKRYRRGLCAGTNPEDLEYWGGFHDVDQRFVEMASISFGLLLVPEILWEPLTEQEKHHLAKWLDGINHYKCPPCNWMFFGVLVNIALKSRGMAYNSKRLDEYLAYIESCYLGNGWYLDGQNGEKDYYVSFAFHYYGLIYARFMKEEDRERCLEYENRARLFAQEFLYWFGEDGSALAYGRSLTYRFAQVSFFSMCISCELEVLPYSVMKGLIVRHLKYWMAQPIWDHSKILTIGYGYPNLLMAEQYNAPGSPYWSMKAFAFLTLPQQHPFWQVEAAPLPKLLPIRLISNGTMLLQRIGGQAFAYVTGRELPHQHVHTEEKYSKFVYSNRYAFSVPRSMHTLEEAAPDSMLAFVLHDMVYIKGITRNGHYNDEGMEMEWSPYEGIAIITTITLLPNGHRRTHQIESLHSCMAYDCGFAIKNPGDHPHTNLDQRNSVERKGDWEERCLVRCCLGEGQEMLITASPNTNLMHPRTVIPAIQYEIHPGSQTIVTEFIHS